jgi:hypothetical protein
MNPVGFIMAVDLTRREVSSALPNAPVVDDRKSARQPVHNMRLVTARILRRAADRVEPAVCAATYG